MKVDHEIVTKTKYWEILISFGRVNFAQEQCFRSGLDPDSIRLLDPDPDPGGKKLLTNIEIFLKFQRCWMFSFESLRLLL